MGRLCCRRILCLVMFFAIQSCGDSSQAEFGEIFDEDTPEKVTCMYDFIVEEFGQEEMRELISSFQRMANRHNTDDERIGSLGQLLGAHMTEIIAAEFHCASTAEIASAEESR